MPGQSNLMFESGVGAYPYYRLSYLSVSNKKVDYAILFFSSLTIVTNKLECSSITSLVSLV